MGQPSLWTLWSTLLLLSPTTTTAFTPRLRPRQLDTSFDWTAITPTPDLQYHPCYNNTFRCARLRVPLDWLKPNTSESGPHAAIAIITLPATVPVTSPEYAGPILLNPGGPGGSGTQAVRIVIVEPGLFANPLMIPTPAVKEGISR
jgi:hypothetical protein